MGPLMWEQLRTAHEWGKRPSELGICDKEEDLAWMTAFTNTKAYMSAWENQTRKKERATRDAAKDAKVNSVPRRKG